jgi:TATA-binding protein-associated factor Taf7
MSGKQHILLAEATRIVVKNDKGIVTFRKRYKRGDVLDVEHIDPAHLQKLIDSGHVTDGTEEVTDDADADLAADAARVRAAGSTGGTGDLGTSSTQSDQDEDAEGDRYDGMSYADLQAEAKQRTGNGGGSAEDLRERLREADAEDDESEDDEEGDGE